MKRLIPLALLAATLLAGCATGPKLSTTEKLALYRDHAGEPVKDFRYFGTLNGWSPLGDAALAVWTKPSEAYLLELSGRCPDLEYAMAISITQFGNRVSARFDDVLQLEVRTLRLGNSSFTLEVDIRRQADQAAIARAEVTYVMVDARAFTKVAIPEAIRALLERGAAGVTVNQAG